MNIKDILKNVLSEDEIKLLKTSFDIIGDIAILEIPEGLEKHKNEIAEAVMKIHKNVRTVCERESERKGRFRLREIKIIKGKKTETIYKEFGCRFKLDVKKVYFSPRESTERKRISDLIKRGETVLVMFSGIAPYGIVIGKHSDAEKIYCIELNKDACKYAKDNVKLNKLENKVETICGDVRDKCETFYEKCDRVVMPLPLEGYKYLDMAIKCLKKKGIIHFYYISSENEIFKEAENIIKEACKKAGKRIKIIGRKKVLPYAPRTWKVCIDAEVSE